MKKGFTLIELLAVIVILAIIALIATPIILNIINNAKVSSNERSAELYIAAVEQAIVRKNFDGKFNPTQCIIENSVVTCDEQELNVEVNGEKPTSGTIILEKGRVASGTTLNFRGYIATVNENNKIEVGKPKIICTAVDRTNATYRTDDPTQTIGTIPVNDTNGERIYAPGDEYICEVKPGKEYHFYVLSVEDDKINLIMNRNIQNTGEVTAGGPTAQEIGWTPWINETDYNLAGGTSWTNLGGTDVGPITALKFLNQATSTWEYIPNVYIKYSDEGKTYGSILSSGTLVNVEKNNSVIYTFENRLKARLATKEELESIGCNDKTKGSCPLWIFNYLANQEGYANAGTVIPANYQYWAMASINYAPGYALIVSQSGYIKGNASAGAANTGIRAVISIPKTQMG